MKTPQLIKTNIVRYLLVIPVYLHCTIYMIIYDHKRTILYIYERFKLGILHSRRKKKYDQALHVYEMSRVLILILYKCHFFGMLACIIKSPR